MSQAEGRLYSSHAALIEAGKDEKIRDMTATSNNDDSFIFGLRGWRRSNSACFARSPRVRGTDRDGVHIDRMR
jgi:hypothetical protein